MRTLMLIGTIALTGCLRTPDLEPAAGATQVPGDGVGAVTSEGQIRIEVRADTWSGSPRSLDAVLPLRVSIRNGSSRALLLRYRELSLEGSSGMTYAALPPYDIRTRDVTQVASAYPADGFRVAPHLRPYYGGSMEVWTEPLPWDPLYYDRYYPELQRANLPTESMLEQAMPEGVVQPGGQITGYVYFQGYGAAEQTLLFEMDLVDAGTGETFATVDIPFEVIRPAS